MAQTLNLQRNSEVFLSTQNLDGGDAVSTLTPANTWKVEILAGYAVSQAAATQDINSSESGTTPDRSSKRFKTAMNPVDWNFQAYIRPTGIENTSGGTNVNTSGNSMPVADWYMWQALMSNTSAYTTNKLTSTWDTGGRFLTAAKAASGNTAAHTSNYGSPTTYNMYFKMDNVIYQVSNVSVGQAVVDAAIDAVATTTWSGQGTNLIELTGTPRNNAVSVFGGTLNNGTTVSANGNAYVTTATHSYQPFDQWNVAGTISTASFIKNRLSSLSVKFQPESGGSTTYTFPVTALSFTYNNNITYLTPEELSKVNTPIGSFTGAREVTGSFTAYLRGASGDSAQFLRDLAADRRPAPTAYSNANLVIGGTTAPYLAFNMPAVVFDVPTHGIEDIITVSVNFKAQEPVDTVTTGGEVNLYAKK